MAAPIAIFQRNYRAGIHKFYTLGDGSSNTPLSDFVNGVPVNETLTLLGGNVGIGSTQPTELLDIKGTVRVDGNVNATNITLSGGTISGGSFSGTATQVVNDLTRGTYLIGDNYNGSVATTWAVDADSANTASKVVVRDASGMIYVANVGVGTTSALYAVDVIGDVNFTGILRQSGTPYASSQWTTTETDIYYSSGDVGIGTFTPLKPLHVIGDILTTGTMIASNLTVLGDTTVLNTISSNTEQMVITNAGTGPALKVTQTGVQPIAEFYDNESGLAMTIANNGLIGIGTTVPRQLLDVQGGNLIVSGNVGIGTTVALAKLSVQGNIIASGNITAFGSASDKKLKNDIEPLESGLDIIQKLKPVKFKWKDNIPNTYSNKKDYGFIAQEVEMIIPELTDTVRLGTIFDPIKIIHYEKITTFLVKAVQEQQKQIDELRQIIDSK